MQWWFFSGLTKGHSFNATGELRHAMEIGLQKKCNRF